MATDSKLVPSAQAFEGFGRYNLTGEAFMHRALKQRKETETKGFSFQKFINKQDQFMTDYLAETYIEMGKAINQDAIDIICVCWLANDIVNMSKNIPSAIENEMFYDMSHRVDRCYFCLSKLVEKGLNTKYIGNIDHEIYILKHLLKPL